MLPGSDPEIDATQAAGFAFRREVVVPRRFCQYHRQDFSALPQRQRSGAARLAARRFEPSPGSAVHIVWLGTVAHFWFFVPEPSDEQAAVLPARWIPESVLFISPAADTARLLKVAGGVEGQVWQSGQLMASQWWPERPALDAWHRFLRGNGWAAQLPVSVPQAEELPWGRVPWGRAQRQGMLGAAAYEKMAWSVLLLAATAILGWQLVALMRWHEAGNEMRRQLEATREKAAPVLLLREQAEAALSEIEALRPLHTGVDDHALMAAVIKVLPEGAQFVSWRRDSGTLRVLVRHPETDPRVFVAAFAGDRQLSSLTASPQGNGVMQLLFPLESAVDDSPAQTE